MNLCVQIGVALDSAPCFGVLTAGSRCISPYGSIEIPAEYFGLDRARKNISAKARKIREATRINTGIPTQIKRSISIAAAPLFSSLYVTTGRGQISTIFHEKSLTAAGVSGILSEKTKKAGCIRLTSRPWQRGQQQLFPWFPYVGGRVVARMHGAFAFFY